MKLNLPSHSKSYGNRQAPHQAGGWMALLVANTVLMTILYYVAPAIGFPYLPVVYLLGGGALALWFVIYNRGFQTKGKTADMLPGHLTLEERERIIAEGERRFRKSRWALTVLLPVIFVFLIDTVYLFILPKGLFS